MLVRVPALVGFELAVELAPTAAAELALAPLGRLDAPDVPDPGEPAWLGGGLPGGRFGGGVPARCWRRRLALLT